MKTIGPFVAQPGFDAVHMYQTYGDDAATVREILEQYLQELPKDLATMQHNFEQRYYGELLGNLHKMKPGFLYVGLHDLYHQVANVEVHCKNGEPHKVLQQHFPPLLQAISQSQQVITAVVNNLSEA